jgi:hypothetical protein
VVRALLEDRFQLKAHREISADQTPPDPRQGFITFASPAEPAAPLPLVAIRMITESSGRTLLASAMLASQLVPVLQG